MIAKIIFNQAVVSERTKAIPAIPEEYTVEIISDDSSHACNFSLDYKTFKDLLNTSLQEREASVILEAEDLNLPETKQTVENLDFQIDPVRLTGNIVEIIEKTSIDNNFNFGEIIRKDRKITILSNDDKVLGLFWEKLLEKYNLRGSGFILRKYLKTKSESKDPKFIFQNIVVFYSNGFNTPNAKLAKISDDFFKETISIIEPVMQNNKGSYKPVLLKLVKYLSESVFTKTEWSDYQIAHFLLHGSKDDCLGFEDPANHQNIEWISAEKFLNLAKEKQHVLNLVFFSCCYSAFAYNLTEKSLALKTVENGVSKYSIGFNGPIGSSLTIPEFVKNFYDILILTNNIEQSFLNACNSIKDKAYWDKPVLYTSGE